ncbi:hypothetical protein MTR67_002443 [Solanum verrucosum]|uniref:Uncharacterized protein n=1 Tax=Solanum verrucosum TaxID=315347 RepID=A0AAF0PPZ1_SOLVR|nr:hypothetical protein MTR67_002443 [Solanum verrucosum]
MGLLYRLFQIRVLNVLLTFGTHSKKGLVVRIILARFFIPKLMVITQVSAWVPLKPCMVGDVALRLVGLRWVKFLFLVSNRFMKPLRKFGSL